MSLKEKPASMAARARRHRAYLTHLLGGVCATCGGSEQLEFHHRDPSEKAFCIGRFLGRISLDRLLVEADKCELRCWPCHLDVTRGDHPTLTFNAREIRAAVEVDA
jgi:hypothetical protein